jgi:hypothetical protein
MKSLSNKQWVLPLLTGASIILSLAGVTQALPLADRDQPRSVPLSPNDPAAQLDPSLVNVPAMPEQNQNTDSSPTYPLSPNDPAAKLDPSLVNVPAMPEQNTDSSPTSRSTQSPDREISYDVGTRSTRVGEIRPLTPSSTSTRAGSPHIGADSKIDPEFPGLVDQK